MLPYEACLSLSPSRPRPLDKPSNQIGGKGGGSSSGGGGGGGSGRNGNGGGSGCNGNGGGSASDGNSVASPVPSPPPDGANSCAVSRKRKGAPLPLHEMGSSSQMLSKRKEARSPSADAAGAGAGGAAAVHAGTGTATGAGVAAGAVTNPVQGAPVADGVFLVPRPLCDVRRDADGESRGATWHCPPHSRAVPIEDGDAGGGYASFDGLNSAGAFQKAFGEDALPVVFVPTASLAASLALPVAMDASAATSASASAAATATTTDSAAAAAAVVPPPPVAPVATLHVTPTALDDMWLALLSLPSTTPVAILTPYGKRTVAAAGLTAAYEPLRATSALAVTQPTDVARAEDTADARDADVTSAALGLWRTAMAATADRASDHRQYAPTTSCRQMP